MTGVISGFTKADLERARRILCRIQNEVRDGILKSRKAVSGHRLSRIAAVTSADTIYRIDKVSEKAVLDAFKKYWPRQWPVEIILEGIEEGVTFPHGSKISKTMWKCILDPIDGTRGLMYDKRPAWILSGLAPQKGLETRLSDIVVAAMTEIPTLKQWRADQISAVKGCGRKGIISHALDIRTKRRSPIVVRPSTAKDFKHGFASFSKFFPEGKGLLAKMEEELWKKLYGLGKSASPLVFDDQYISTGGQIYEILMGHDRMVGDLRSLALKKLRCSHCVACHPYDACTSMILNEAGGVFETLKDVPLDTETPVAWMGYANESLAKKAKPLLARLIKKYLK